MLDILKELAPSISISVSRELDPYESWDGDGPGPRDDGYDPYDVTVTARAIVNGELTAAESFLSLNWYCPEEPIGDVHGYLPQMIDEALDELKGKPFLPVEIQEQIIKAQMFVAEEMKRRWTESMLKSPIRLWTKKTGQNDWELFSGYYERKNVDEAVERIRQTQGIEVKIEEGAVAT